MAVICKFVLDDVNGHTWVVPLTKFDVTDPWSMACDWSTATDPPFLLVVVEIDTLFSKLDNYYPLPLAPATHHSNNCQLLHKPFKNNSFLNDISKKKSWQGWLYVNSNCFESRKVVHSILRGGFRLKTCGQLHVTTYNHQWSQEYHQ